jgi:hypothetical protein
MSVVYDPTAPARTSAHAKDGLDHIAEFADSGVRIVQRQPEDRERRDAGSPADVVPD